MSRIRSIQQGSRRILVTGGAGFIGTHLCRSLLTGGNSVTIVDDCSTGRPENVRKLREEFPGARITFLEGDVRDALPHLVHVDFDEIHHLASVVGVRLIVDQPVRAAEVNFECTSRVLRFALEARSHHGRSPVVLLASSSEVYGRSCKLPLAEDEDAVFGPTTSARWSYAHAKALGEHMALAYHQQHGLEIVEARLFNTVGPGQTGAYGMVMPRFVAAAVEGRPLDLYGDGRQRRCFCDVRDVIEAVVSLMRNSRCHGRVFNVGSDCCISITELAQRVISLTGSRSGTRLVPYERVYGADFEEPRERRPDLTRLREAIGFAPRFSLERTILDIARSMRNAKTPQLAVA